MPVYPSYTAFGPPELARLELHVASSDEISSVQNLKRENREMGRGSEGVCGGGGGDGSVCV